MAHAKNALAYPTSLPSRLRNQAQSQEPLPLCTHQSPTPNQEPRNHQRGYAGQNRRCPAQQVRLTKQHSQGDCWHGTDCRAKQPIAHVVSEPELERDGSSHIVKKNSTCPYERTEKRTDRYTQR